MPQELRGHVEPVEVRPVAHHHHDLVAGRQAEALQRRGRCSDLVAVLVERPFLPATRGVHAAQRDAVGIGSDGLQEHPGHGLARDRPIHLFDAGPSHDAPLSDGGLKSLTRGLDTPPLREQT